MVQTELRYENMKLVCWLPVDPRVKVGTRLSLKGDPETVYTVAAQYNATKRELSSIEKTWHVGGL